VRGAKTLLQRPNQALARFQDLVGHNTILGVTIFAFNICLKHIFLGATKFGGTKEI